MMKNLVIVSTTLLALVFAAPTSLDLRQTTVNPTTTNFIKALPILSIQPIGILGGINWNSLIYGKTGNLQTAVVVPPNSGANVAIFSKANLAPDSQGGFPGMRITYSNSPYDFFSLYSFYYACELNTQTAAASVPIGCKFTVKGYTDDGGTHLVAQQSYDFGVQQNLLDLVLSTPMLKATLPSTFKNLKRVDFSISSSGIAPGVIIAGLIDTVVYSLHHK